MAAERRPRRRRSAAGMVRWHRRIGLAAAAFLVFLAVTGTLLGRADRLGLTGTEVEWSPVLALYGRTPPHDPVAFRAGETWVAWIDGTLFVSETQAARDTARPLGAARAGPAIAVAAGEAVYLLDAEGALIERLSGPALPGTPQALGRGADGRLALRTEAGTYLADRALVNWDAAAADAGIRWSEPTALPAEREAALLELWRGPGPSWDRVLADLHSGRILGPWGPWLVDALSLAVIALAVTGVIQWARRR